MTQKTMTERDTYLAAFEREYQTTLKVLRAYPSAKADLKPAEKLRSAHDLAWMLVLNQMVVRPTLEGKLEPGAMPAPPSRWDEVVAGLEREHRETTVRL